MMPALFLLNVRVKNLYDIQTISIRVNKYSKWRVKQLSKFFNKPESSQFT